VDSYQEILSGVVGLSYMDCSLNDFARRLVEAIKAEQEKPSPDNALIALLCDAARVGWEFLLRRPSALEAAEVCEGEGEDMIQIKVTKCRVDSTGCEDCIGKWLKVLPPRDGDATTEVTFAVGGSRCSVNKEAGDEYEMRTKPIEGEEG